jgi:hypothetical protein
MPLGSGTSPEGKRLRARGHTRALHVPCPALYTVRRTTRVALFAASFAYGCSFLPSPALKTGTARELRQAQTHAPRGTMPYAPCCGVACRVIERAPTWVEATKYGAQWADGTGQVTELEHGTCSTASADRCAVRTCVLARWSAASRADPSSGWRSTTASHAYASYLFTRMRSVTAVNN